MPPWPSVVTGAVISRALADQNRVGQVTMAPDQADHQVREALGEDFCLRSLWILSRGTLWFPAPADLAVLGEELHALTVRRMVPRKLPSGLATSCPLEMLPVLDVKERRKPAESVWLSMEGWQSYLQGVLPQASQVITADQLWAVDPRLGIALDARSRTVKTGTIYTTDAVAVKTDTHLIAAFSGNNIPTEGLLRLGGDGRAAEIRQADPPIRKQLEGFGRPKAGWKSFRMILATPGLFPLGWLPPGVDQQAGYTIRVHGLKARLVAAAIPRPQVISGWDLATQAPKPAQKVIPAGACYWFTVDEGDSAVLQRLHEEGLWSLMEKTHPAYRRKREGWNHVWFGSWT